MLLHDIQNKITSISDDSAINTKNFLDSLSYIDNLYIFISKLETIIDVRKVEFLPSYRSSRIAEEMGILNTPEEEELRLFRIKYNSDLFNLVDDNTVYEQMINILGDICSIQINDSEIKFILM